jgi:hypothetical protein
LGLFCFEVGEDCIYVKNVLGLDISDMLVKHGLFSKILHNQPRHGNDMKPVQIYHLFERFHTVRMINQQIFT